MLQFHNIPMRLKQETELADQSYDDNLAVDNKADLDRADDENTNYEVKLPYEQGPSDSVEEPLDEVIESSEMVIPQTQLPQQGPQDGTDSDYEPPSKRPGLTERGRPRGGGRGLQRGMDRGRVRTRGGRGVQRGRVRTRGKSVRRGGRPIRPISPVAVWRKDKEFIPPHVEWKGSIGNPTPNVEQNSPFYYFKTFIDDDLLLVIKNQTNLYAQQNGVQLDATMTEIQQFIGIVMYTGIANFPKYRMFWEVETRFPPVADVMSRLRFDLLLRYFHCVDNTTRVPGQDRLFKVRPLLNAIVNVCRAIPQEEHQSVDEHMIPFKGTSCMKQYVKKEPKNWGYKVFMRCGASGILYDFSIYIGKETCNTYNLGFSGDIVVDLCTDLPNYQNFRIFTDNWFTSIPMFTYLKNKGIWATGVLRNDRTHHCPLQSDEDLQKEGRGAYDSAVDVKNGLLVIRWLDKKCITMLSSIDTIGPVGTCKRWSKTTNQQVDVPRPAIVRSYNESMGGVDLFGMLIALYRVGIRSRRGYLRIVYWVFNVAVVNGWLIYRRHMKQLELPQKYNLLKFQTYIARTLCTSGMTERKKAGRPKLNTLPITPKRGPKKLFPVAEMRFDGVAHWPVPKPNKLRCALCKTGQSRITCSKCKLNLCLTNVKNCFFTFHNNGDNQESESDGQESGDEVMEL